MLAGVTWRYDEDRYLIHAFHYNLTMRLVRCFSLQYAYEIGQEHMMIEALHGASTSACNIDPILVKYRKFPKICSLRANALPPL